MGLAKKILLSLIFSLSISCFLFYLGISLFKLVQPPADESEKLGVISGWILAGLFFLSSISSVFWLINFDSGFWGWKIPALLILPLSIPFLILDFRESKQPPKAAELPMVKEFNDQKKRQDFFVILMWITALNLVLIIIELVGFVVLATLSSGWYSLLTIIPLSTGAGTLFLVKNYSDPSKTWFWLSLFGLTFNWFFLFLEIIDQKEIAYLIPPTKLVAES